MEALTSSRIYRDYERAFSDLTGLPVALQPVETWQLPHHGKRNENAFCALLSNKNRSCAACLQTQERLCLAAASGPETVTCPVGLSDSAVPVRMSDRLVGFLQIGQVFRKKPTEAQFNKTAATVQKMGSGNHAGSAAQGLLFRQGCFAQGTRFRRQAVDNFCTASGNGEQSGFHPAREFRAAGHRQGPRLHPEHQTEDLSLGQVAKAVNMSSYYFCKMFKKVAGINFTDYVARVRIEKSKNLLLNPNLRVSEIAFEVGFQSLTHFNRVFKKILGQSPTEYRAQLLAH